MRRWQLQEAKNKLSKKLSSFFLESILAEVLLDFSRNKSRPGPDAVF